MFLIVFIEVECFTESTLTLHEATMLENDASLDKGSYFLHVSVFWLDDYHLSDIFLEHR